MKNRCLLLLFCALALPLLVAAQNIALPPRFASLLAQTQVEWLAPLDAGYLETLWLENEFQSCQFAIASRHEDLRIAYCILPFNIHDPASVHPELLGFRAVASAASNNSESTLISALETEPEILQKDFNADWGMTWFFQPKPGFSDSKHCRMTAIYKEGRGTALIFYLFDDPGNPALDVRQAALRFL